MNKKFEILPVSMELLLNAKDCMWDYKLLPRDAIHLSMCFERGVKAIATTNPDFSNASGDVDIYTCNTNMLNQGNGNNI